MTPMGFLMIEHRLIERMVRLLDAELAAMRSTGQANAAFLVAATDFIRSFADQCHHGKEEGILFQDLEKKPLEKPLRQILHELIAEHAHARQVTARLAAATERYQAGDNAALDDLQESVQELVRFYPQHIEKEDRHFFVPIMSYFTPQELEEMLQRFYEFDRQLIHERYREVVTRWEAK